MIDLGLYQRAYVELQQEFGDAQNDFLRRIRAAQLRFMETVSGRAPEVSEAAARQAAQPPPLAERLARGMGQLREFTDFE